MKKLLIFGLIAFALLYVGSDDMKQTINDTIQSVVYTMTGNKRHDLTLQYLSLAEQIELNFGLRKDFILSHSWIETNLGSSGIAKKSNNFFNIKKGSTWQGETIDSLQTENLPDGSPYKEKSKFRKYDAAYNSFNDYANLIINRYPECLQANTWAEYLTILKQNGYATDKDYVSKFLSVNDKTLKIIHDFYNQYS